MFGADAFEKGDGFRQVTHAPPHCPVGRRGAVDGYCAAVRREQAEHHFDQGGFPRAVVSGQRDALALRDVQLHIADCAEVFEVFADLFDVYGWSVHGVFRMVFFCMVKRLW